MEFYLPQKMLKQCFAEGVKCYPEEACGLITGLRAESSLQNLELLPMKNVMTLYHERDPKRFPRTNLDGYLIEPLQFVKAEKQLASQGRCIKLIFHSHPDVGAYFSEQDQDDALWNDEPRYPNVDYLVCGIKQGRPDGAIIARYNTQLKSFDIAKLPSN